MSWLTSVFLGLVQGLTEFIPVSSSGHLVLFQHFLGLHEGQLAFDIAVHFGTLLSVLTIYRRELLELNCELWRGLKGRSLNSGLLLFFYVFLASIPTGLMGIFLRDYWSTLFSQMHFVGIFLLATGFLLFKTKNSTPHDSASFSDGRGSDGMKTNKMYMSKMDAKSLNWKKALGIGVAQGFAILPGVSRSGTTIAMAVMLGVDRSLAAFFSFLLLIPAVTGASLLEFSHISWAEIDILQMAIGFAVAYLSGLAGLSIVLKFVKKGRLEVFSPYLWTLGSGLIIYAIFQGT